MMKPNYPRDDINGYLRTYFPALHLTSESLVLDIGANEGWFALTCAEKGATVLAFEPNPYAFEHAFARLASFDKAFVINAAISDTSGIASLYFPEEYHLAPELHSGSASTALKNANVVSSTGIPCLKVSLDMILGAVDRVDFLKVDIEGTEAELWPTILRHSEKIEYLAMETHGWLVGVEPWIKDAQEFITQSGRGDRWRLDWP